MQKDQPEGKDIRWIERTQPIKKLFLFDVMQDKDSRPIFLWAGGVLL
ncbi:MAG: hypothetical protein HGA28_06470, partial [Anaerolineaceae bacterium]|nr:hypothetical protein [Anaerolineaceae bacterium]